MRLNAYINMRRGNARHLAGILGVHQSYVSQMASGYRPVSPERCLAIERATGGLVTRRDLRADWQQIWPELSEEGRT